MCDKFSWMFLVYKICKNHKIGTFFKSPNFEFIENSTNPFINFKKVLDSDNISRFVIV